MRYLIYLLVLVAPLFAQQGTTISPLQLREWGALDSSPKSLRLYTVDPSKQGVIQINPGAGLTLRSTSEGWVLEAAAPPAPAVYQVDRRLTRDAFGNYAAPAGALILLNGIGVEEGEDYRREGGFVVPFPEPWTEIDKVRAIYLESRPPTAALGPEPGPTRPRAASGKNAALIPDGQLVQYLGPDPWPPGAHAGQAALQGKFRLTDRPVMPATRVSPRQIRNWTQLRSPQSFGTSLALDQVDKLAEVASFWQAHAVRRSGEGRRILPCPFRWPFFI